MNHLAQLERPSTLRSFHKCGLALSREAPSVYEYMRFTSREVKGTLKELDHESVKQMGSHE
jgi:hypothetical protein